MKTYVVRQFMRYNMVCRESECAQRSGDSKGQLVFQKANAIMGKVSWELFTCEIEDDFFHCLGTNTSEPPFMCQMQRHDV